MIYGRKLTYYIGELILNIIVKASIGLQKIIIIILLAGSLYFNIIHSVAVAEIFSSILLSFFY